MENRRWRFTGEVQGVGFRWRAQRLAERHGLVGWVRNCSDGSVEIEAEGGRAALNAFLAELSEIMGSHIDNAAGVDEQTAPATGRYQAFTVEYDF